MLKITNSDKVIQVVLILVCLIATLLFLFVPADSLNTGLVYKGF